MLIIEDKQTHQAYEGLKHMYPDVFWAIYDNKKWYLFEDEEEFKGFKNSLLSTQI